MKTATRNFLIVTVLFAFTATALPFTAPLPPIKKKAEAVFSYGSTIENMEQQLQNDLWSDLDQAKVGYAMKLADVKTEENVEDLVYMLNNEENDNVRIAAGFSLLKLGDHKGIDAVIETANNDKDSRVKNALAALFFQRVKNTTTAASK